MRVLFLHLTDMHLEKAADWDNKYAKLIAQALRPQNIGNIDKVFVFVTGDIAFSGRKSEYSYAHQLLHDLIVELQAEIKSGSEDGLGLIHIFVVPGNHDISYSTPLHDRAYYEAALASDPSPAVIEDLSNQKNFMEFSNRRHSLDSHHELFIRKVVSVGEFTIEINLINSAIFSLLDSDDKGLHYLPQSTIDAYCTPSGSDFAITLMHHPIEWYNDKCKLSLEQAIYAKNTMVFYGHQHVLGTENISLNEIIPAKVFFGGELCNRGDWSSSHFFACVYEPDTEQCTHYSFKLSSTGTVYTKEIEFSGLLKKKPSTAMAPLVRQDYVDELLKDTRQLSGSVLDYFVCPRLKNDSTDRNKDKRKEIVNCEQLFAEIETSKHVELQGLDSSGKSTLLKAIFCRYYNYKYTLFCSVENISSGNRKRIIKNLFEETYGESPESYAKFEQADKSQKMILIDDLHLISENNVDAFLAGIEEEFGYVVYTTSNLLEMSIEERIKNAILKDTYSKLKFAPFYQDKRYELIEKVLALKSPALTGDELKSQVEKISSVLDLQRKYLLLTPEIIIQFIGYYTAYQFDTIQNDGNIFGKVFEATITNSLAPNISGNLTVDKIFLLLGKIAFYIHSEKQYPISETSIGHVISAYCEEYGGKISVHDFIACVEKSKILCRYGDRSHFKFFNNNYLAYFIAKEICLSRNEAAVKNCLNYACFGINATILLFVTYLTNDLTIFEVILKQSAELVAGWKEFRFGTPELPFLTIKLESFPLGHHSLEEEKKEEKDCMLEEDREKIDTASIETINIYDYDEDNVNSLPNQLIRACMLQQTLSQCLPSFEHLMKRDQKKAVVKAIYEIPNQIFYAYAKEVADNEDDLIHLIMQTMESSEFSRKKITKEDAHNFLQWDSLSLLIDLYGNSVNRAYRQNTFEYLNDPDWIDLAEPTYQIENLMVLRKRDNPNEFIHRAEELHEKIKDPAAKLTFSRIVRQFLIRASLPTRKIHSLENKFFPNNQDSHLALVRDRSKYAKEK